MHVPTGVNLIVIMMVALIVFGPQKLPDIARSMAKAINEFRGAFRDMGQHLDLHGITADLTGEPRAYPGSVSSSATPSFQDSRSGYDSAQAYSAAYEDSQGQSTVGTTGPGSASHNQVSNPSIMIG
jgi:TatA/E family protein of Tat protein translocase